MNSLHSQLPSLTEVGKRIVSAAADELYLFVGTDDELSPLLQRLRRGDFPVGDVGGNQADQTIVENLSAIIHKVLLRGQFSQVLLLRRGDTQGRETIKTQETSGFFMFGETFSPTGIFSPSHSDTLQTSHLARSAGR